MEVIFYLFLFFIGAVFGSFIDVLADRVVRGRTFILSRSKCDNCQKKLSAFDLIPLFSFTFLKGKCRYCKHKIPKRLFVVELGMGLLFFLSYHLTSLGIFSLVIFLLLLSLLIAIFVADLRFGIIPDQFLIAFAVFSFIFLIAQFTFQGFGFVNALLLLVMHVIAGIGAFAAFFLIFYLTHGRGIGFGDVKFSFVIGFLLSFKLMIGAFYIAFLTGALISLILIIARKKKFKGDTIPFGPFLVFGTVISLLFEGQVITIMQNLFGI